MAQKTALVLKDNAGVAMDPAFVGAAGPSILEVWFPGQEDGNIVADLLFGLKNPSGKLPVTFPIVGKGFLDHATPQQFPGVVTSDGKTQTLEYSEGLHIGYRWYDGNISGQCAVVNGLNPCVAFPFGHGLSYTTFSLTSPSVTLNASTLAYEYRPGPVRWAWRNRPRGWSAFRRWTSQREPRRTSWCRSIRLQATTP